MRFLLFYPSFPREKRRAADGRLSGGNEKSEKQPDFTESQAVFF
jgi:hypothetical protein